jgi:lipopolysaccharide export LptBFGC system permease protein LptF
MFYWKAMVRKATRYILGEMVLWSVIGLAGAIFLFITTQLVRIAPLLVGAGGSPRQLFEMLLWLVVPVCGWSITPAFAVAAFATFGRMSRDGELLAMDAAGIPRGALLRGPVWLGLVLTLASGAIWLAAGPWSQHRLQMQFMRFAKQTLVRQIPDGRFVEPAEGTTFYADKKGRDGIYRGVFFENTEEGGRTVQVAATRARLTADPDFPTARFHLEEGTAFLTDSTPDAGRASSGNRQALALTFDTLDIAVPLDEAISGRMSFLPRTMAYPTARLLGPPPKGMSAVDWRYALWRRIAGPVGTLVFSVFALFLSVGAQWRSRGIAVALAGLIFFVYHLAGRFGETLMISGGLPVPVAALGPSVLVALVFFALLFRSARSFKSGI